MNFGEVLSKMKRLTSITLCDVWECSGEIAMHLESLTGLRSLELSECKDLRDANVHHLTRLTQLRHLDIHNSKVHDFPLSLIIVLQMNTKCVLQVEVF